MTHNYCYYYYLLDILFDHNRYSTYICSVPIRSIVHLYHYYHCINRVESETTDTQYFRHRWILACMNTEQA